MKFFHLNFSRKVSHRHLVFLIGLGQVIDGLVCVMTGTLVISRFGFEAVSYLSRRRIDDIKKITRK